jgi:hypothetical protein
LIFPAEIVLTVSIPSDTIAPSFDGGQLLP